MQTHPYHSVTRFLHHLYPDCEVGMQIDPKDLASGTGSKPMCRLCYERKKAEDKAAKNHRPTNTEEAKTSKAVH